MKWYNEKMIIAPTNSNSREIYGNPLVMTDVETPNNESGTEAFNTENYNCGHVLLWSSRHFLGVFPP
jgi:hypothetical protein